MSADHLVGEPVCFVCRESVLDGDMPAYLFPHGQPVHNACKTPVHTVSGINEAVRRRLEARALKLAQEAQHRRAEEEAKLQQNQNWYAFWSGLSVGVLICVFGYFVAVGWR